MKVIYTSGKNKIPVYLTDGQYEIVKDTKLYMTQGQIVLNCNGKSRNLTSLLYPKRRGVYRIDTTLHDYRPSNIKSKIKLEGVQMHMAHPMPYYTCSISYEGKTRLITGRYNTEREAVIVREAYIIKNNLSETVRNTLKGLTDQDILDKYEGILSERRVEEERLKKLKEHRSKAQSRNYFEYYGIKVTNVNSKRKYSAMVNGVNVGSSAKLIVAQCIRNLYIIDNNIQGDKLCSIGRTVEEQRNIVHRHTTTKAICTTTTKKHRNTVYKGVARRGVGRNGSYTVTVSEKNTRVHIGSSKNKIIAAMMYNVHKYLIGEIKEPLHDVGISIEDQLENILSNGYYMTEEFTFRRPK